MSTEGGGGIGGFLRGITASQDCGASPNQLSSLARAVGGRGGGGGSLVAMQDRWMRVAQRPPTVVPLSSEQMTDILHTFIHSTMSATPMPVGMIPDPGLSAVEQMKIMQRSQMLARHMCADQPPEFADSQVGAILGTLHISPEQLEAFDAGWDAGEYTGQFEGAWASQTGGDWAEEFAAAPQLPQDQPETWAQQFVEQGETEEFFDNTADLELEKAWNAEESAAAPAKLSDPIERELEKQRLREATGRLVDAVSDPKVRATKFMQFMNQLRTGEMEVKDNTVVVGTAANTTTGEDWATEFHGTTEETTSWASEFQGTEETTPWETEYENDVNTTSTTTSTTAESNSVWANEYADETEGTDNWADQYSSTATQNAPPVTAYQFSDQETNPFLNHSSPFGKGMEFYNEGNVGNAILALEAELIRNPTNAQAWQVLGQAQAENDSDAQAIAALSKANELDPGNRETLMALAVSSTNDFSKDTAVNSLKQWLQSHPKYKSIPEPPPVTVGESPIDQRFSQLMTSFTNHIAVLGMFLEAARLTPTDVDPDIQTGLGLLFNLSYEYEKAVDCLKAALSKKPTDYLLWNKLGATLANAANNADAVDAYNAALQLRPSYVRALSNLGISHIALKNYDAAAVQFLRALASTGGDGAAGAEHVWEYLELAFKLLQRDDLVKIASLRNVDFFHDHFDF
ncbi:peroxisome biogenesis protein 5 [Pelomyxa schiedti]|nr:peroxisome biogenesis protein 5 [Pelomyxa schiedti]